MKRLDFAFDEFQAHWALSPSRAKRDVIRLLMKVIKVMSPDLNANLRASSVRAVLLASK